MVTHNQNSEVADLLLGELAALYGVQLQYRRADGQQTYSPRASIAAVLRSLGARLPACIAQGEPWDAAALESAIQARRLEEWQRVSEPVLVAWEGVLPDLVLRLPQGEAGAVRLWLELEEGRGQEWLVEARDLRLVEQVQLGSQCYEAWRLALPWTRRSSLGQKGNPRPSDCWWGPLPWGYHRLRVEVGRILSESSIISAPRRCYPVTSSGFAAERSQGKWGLFAPVYALRSGREWGAGDLAELELFAQRTKEAGGEAVATLPLLAAFLEKPLEPSPYRPVSRLFWNEFYLAIERLPEWAACADAHAIWEAASTQTQVRLLRETELVDYQEVMGLKRRVLEQLVSFLFEPSGTERSSERLAAFTAWVEQRPEARAYAHFRSLREARTAKVARVAEGSSDAVSWSWKQAPAAELYHLYCQWQMDEQLAALSKGGDFARLFLDLPVGVHPEGFDVWRWPELFAENMSVGAPPDGFFSLGQCWATPPLHPSVSRVAGHKYFALCLRHHMQKAAYLRIDHVMSLHRLFWIPASMTPLEGVYVSYPAEELYAVLSLESHRNQTVVVGEDLGTVPSEVRPALRRHGVLRTWVAQASFRPRAADPVGHIPAGAIASINTHDMFPLRGFLRGDDIWARLASGQVEEGAARREAAARHRLVARLISWARQQELELQPELQSPTGPMAVAAALNMCDALTVCTGQSPNDLAEVDRLPEAYRVLNALLARLNESDASLTLINLEDLVGETRPQNVPGTGSEAPNWRRKMRMLIR